MELITTSLPYTGVMSSLIGGRKENQDTVGYSNTSRGLLLVVCDGMGGGPGGKTASFIATKTIIAYVNNGKPVPGIVEDILGMKVSAPAEDADATVAMVPEVPTPAAPSAPAADNASLLSEAVKYANRCLHDAVALNPALRGMGTTATVVLLDDERAVLAHVGDSRIYQLRGSRMVFRTADHSFVGELVRNGKLSEEQARLSAKSNIITRALGADTDVDVDIDIRPYEKGDRFILCTDGIWGSMPEPELIKQMARKGDLGVALDTLDANVEAAGMAKGGKHDNYSAIILETQNNSILKEKMSTKVKITGILLAVVCFASIIANIVLLAGSKPAEDPAKIQALTMEVDSLKTVNDSVVMKLNEANAKVIEQEAALQEIKKATERLSKAETKSPNKSTKNTKSVKKSNK